MPVVTCPAGIFFVFSGNAEPGTHQGTLRRGAADADGAGHGKLKSGRSLCGRPVRLPGFEADSGSGGAATGSQPADPLPDDFKIQFGYLHLVAQSCRQRDRQGTAEVLPKLFDAGQHIEFSGAISF